MKKIENFLILCLSFFCSVYLTNFVNEGTLTTQIQWVFVEVYLWGMLFFFIKFIKKKSTIVFGNKKQYVRMYLIVGLAIIGTVFSSKDLMPRRYLATPVTVKAIEDRNVLSQGYEIWLLSGNMSGSTLELSQMAVSERGWGVNGSALYTNGENAAEALSFFIPKNQKLELQFAKHAWSGMVEISYDGICEIYDLYDSGNGNLVIEIQSAVREYTGVVNVVHQCGLLCLYIILLGSLALMVEKCKHKLQSS